MARSPARKLGGVAAWLAGGGDALVDGAVVVSPHLDDAVFSLGAALAYAARHGARIRVLTVLAGDPASAAPAGGWDRASGFATAGEAARSRREEDAAACEILGVTPVWLPFSDHQYERGADAAAIRAAVEETVADADAVLVPGFPLQHEDHAWLAETLDGLPYGRYVEQPYAALWHDSPPGDGWTRARAAVRDRRAKSLAWGAYASQLAQLGEGAERRTVRWEASRGGELVAR